jgi:hypothetical protein
MKTLFLDIDGVLHPTTVGELEYDEAGPRVTGVGVGVGALEAERAARCRERRGYRRSQHVDLHARRSQAAG